MRTFNPLDPAQLADLYETSYVVGPKRLDVMFDPNTAMSGDLL